MAARFAADTPTPPSGAGGEAAAAGGAQAAGGGIRVAPGSLRRRRSRFSGDGFSGGVVTSGTSALAETVLGNSQSAASCGQVERTAVGRYTAARKEPHGLHRLANLQTDISNKVSAPIRSGNLEG